MSKGSTVQQTEKNQFEVSQNILPAENMADIFYTLSPNLWPTLKTCISRSSRKLSHCSRLDGLSVQQTECGWNILKFGDGELRLSLKFLARLQCVFLE